MNKLVGVYSGRVSEGDAGRAHTSVAHVQDLLVVKQKIPKVAGGITLSHHL